jgi:Fe-S cluster assembly protein SufD
MAGVTHYEKTFGDIEGALSSAGPDWLHGLRRQGLAAFKTLGFPGLRDEAWRGTRVKPIADKAFGAVASYQPNGFKIEDLRRHTFEDHECRRITFVDGHFAPELSSVCDVPEGVILTSLKQALADMPQLVEPHLGKVVSFEQAPFVALNTAFIHDGAFVYLSDNVMVKDPIHVAFVTTRADAVTHPRLLVVAGKNAQATIVESYVGTGDAYFTNVVSEFVCGENAQLTHCKLQREARSAFHVATQHADLAANSRFATENVSIGGALVRNDVNSVLGGEGIDCRVDGLYLAGERQHVDNHTYIRHAQPHCHSFELYKGILNGRARGVFNGKIYVDPDAQKTDAKQSNSCILLSDNARVNTQPQLEIFADDVKCTHGATVGQLDEDAVFYLRSRGIADNEARNILVYAFAAEVLERITVDSIRNRLEADLFDWLQEYYAQEG